MKALSRVVWSEGMHLSQHHFQLQSRYFEDATSFAVSNLNNAPYGLLACELDDELLLNGTVAVRHARGVMPDGLPFQFPDDPLPAPLEIGERFSPTRSQQVVHLWVRAFRPEDANCPDEPSDGDGARYLPWPRTAVDETTGREEKEVVVARKNFHLSLDDETPEDVVALPIARVVRDASGRFVYDADYVPPCLRISASGALMGRLGRLVDILDQKAGSLAVERRLAHSSAAEYAGREVAGFWLSHTVHAGLAVLRHHLHIRSTHPEGLFLELSRLAGALCTFSFEAHPSDLPVYDHDDLESCFSALDQHVRRHLEVVMPTNRVAVPLEPSGDYLHTGHVPDPRCFRPDSSWFLGVRADMGTGELVDHVTRLVKVCSARHVMRLVREAYPGMELSHVPTPPSELSPRLGSQYFAVRKTEPCWTTIVESDAGPEETGRVGVYVPEAIPGAEVELVVVLAG